MMHFNDDDWMLWEREIDRARNLALIDELIAADLPPLHISFDPIEDGP